MNEFVETVIANIIDGTAASTSTVGVMPPRPNYQRSKPQKTSVSIVADKKDKKDPYAFLRSKILNEPVVKTEITNKVPVKVAVKEHICCCETILIDEPSKQLTEMFGVRRTLGETLCIIKNSSDCIFPLLAIDELTSSWNIKSNNYHMAPHSVNKEFFVFVAEKSLADKAIKSFKDRSFAFCKEDLWVIEKVSNFLSRRLQLSTRYPVVGKITSNSLKTLSEIDKYYKENKDSMLKFQCLREVILVQGELDEAMKALRQVAT